MNQPTLDILLSEAMRHHRIGNLAQAQADCRRLLRSHPGNPDALHLWGLCQQQSGRPQQGAELIRRALVHHPSAAAYHNSLAACHRVMGQSELAIRHDQEAIRLDAYGYFLDAVDQIMESGGLGGDDTKTVEDDVLDRFTIKLANAPKCNTSL